MKQSRLPEYILCDFSLEGFIERRMSPYAGDEERSVDVSSETTGPVATEENSKAT